MATAVTETELNDLTVTVTDVRSMRRPRAISGSEVCARELTKSSVLLPSSQILSDFDLVYVDTSDNAEAILRADDATWRSYWRSTTNDAAPTRALLDLLGGIPGAGEVSAACALDDLRATSCLASVQLDNVVLTIGAMSLTPLDEIDDFSLDDVLPLYEQIAIAVSGS